MLRQRTDRVWFSRLLHRPVTKQSSFDPEARTGAGAKLDFFVIHRNSFGPLPFLTPPTFTWMTARLEARFIGWKYDALTTEPWLLRSFLRITIESKLISCHAERCKLWGWHNQWQDQAHLRIALFPHGTVCYSPTPNRQGH